jgi:hypothetical protein
MDSSNEDARDILEQLDDMMQSISPERLLQRPASPGLQPTDLHAAPRSEDSSWMEPEESDAEESSDDEFTESLCQA